MSKTTVDKILKIARAEVGTKATNIKRCKYNTAFYGAEVSGSCYDSVSYTHLRAHET